MLVYEVMRMVITDNRGVIQLVECVIWDHDAARSSRATPITTISGIIRWSLLHFHPSDKNATMIRSS